MKTNTKGICQVALIPMRSEPSERGEQVNQIIFGETYTILESKNNWSYVETHFDNYKGWISSKMITELEHDTKGTPVFLKDAIGRIIFPGNPTQYQWIPGGASLFEDVSEFNNFNETFTFDPICQLHSPNSIKTISETALKYLKAPYLWGGRSIMGIDCSGFTQIIYKMNGIPILRDASQQADQGILINFIEEAKEGDLVFFDNEESKIIHVGIILEKGKVIHASGEVRIDKIDHQGIFNQETGKYTHKLRLIRRIIPD